MKAVQVKEHGGPEVLGFADIPIPEPRADEVRIAVKAAGMNHLDLWVRKGVEGHTFPLPLVLGCDGAGVIDASGELVRHVKVGDRVAISPGLSDGSSPESLRGEHNLSRDYGIVGETRDGTNAEFLCIPARNVLPMPEDMSFENAAAAPLVFLTAWHMVVNRCGIKAGDDVLIHAAGSGVSMAAIQIAKMHGARVFTTAGSDEKVKRGLELGADHAFNYRETDFRKEVAKITNKRGADIIVDHVGGENFAKSIRTLARGGRVVTCGATADPALISDIRLIFFKNLSILGSTMGGMGEMHEVWGHLCAGKLKPVVAEVLKLDDVARGHQLLEERAVFGKVILKP
ncbi:MAG: zinc-binding dehydrogenase [Planctomycetota bacterium]